MNQVFNYKARNLSGKLVCGKVESSSPGGVASLLREKGCFAVEIKPARGAVQSTDKIFSRKIDLKSMSFLCRQLSAMLDAGIPLLQCLNILAAQTENKRLTIVLRDVTASVEKGNSLSSAFKAHRDCLPEIFINMIAAGEASGTLGQAAARLTTHFEKEHRSKEKIKSALTYPLLVAVLVFASVIGIMVFVVPVFAGLFESMGAELPLPTRIVIGLSGALASYWYVLLLSSAVLFFILKWAGTQKSSNIVLHRFLLRLPLVGRIARQTIVARFTRTLATLLMSGMPLMQSLEVVENVSGSNLVAQEINKVRTNIRVGERIAPVLKKSMLFPPMAAHMIAVGEESGRLNNILERLAVFYEEEADNLFAGLSSLIEPLLIAAMGLIVAFVALSIYLPLFGMSDIMQAGPGGGM
ncbi:type II secretion system F family protein [Pelotomaculum propionicicum]|uniref:type II secretion system F family protein n=1 Tax=Pelotomaculum propionicicum TaxID=258475 RepID=UPI003B7B2759